MAKKPKTTMGRPVTVGADAQTLVTLPAELLEQVREAARQEGISAAEWWRRAARLRLSTTPAPPSPAR